MKTRVSSLVELVQVTRNDLSITLSFHQRNSTGPWPLIHQNCEGMYNLKVESDGKVINGTHIARTITRENIELLQVPQHETRCTLLGSLFLSEGKPGKVLKVSVKKRIGEDDFVASMRKVLTDFFPEDKMVGLGGVFLLKTGRARHHVMDDFLDTPIVGDDAFNEWLTFHDLKSELIAVGTLVVGFDASK
jgi:hypothetical protein